MSLDSPKKQKTNSYGIGVLICLITLLLSSYLAGVIAGFSHYAFFNPGGAISYWFVEWLNPIHGEFKPEMTTWLYSASAVYFLIASLVLGILYRHHRRYSVLLAIALGYTNIYAAIYLDYHIQMASRI